MAYIRAPKCVTCPYLAVRQAMSGARYVKRTKGRWQFYCTHGAAYNKHMTRSNEIGRYVNAESPVGLKPPVKNRPKWCPLVKEYATHEKLHFVDDKPIKEPWWRAIK